MDRKDKTGEGLKKGVVHVWVLAKWVGEVGPAWECCRSQRRRWTRFRKVQRVAGGCVVGYGAALRDLGPALRQICGLPSMGDRCAHPHLPPSPCHYGVPVP